MVRRSSILLAATATILALVLPPQVGADGPITPTIDRCSAEGLGFASCTLPCDFQSFIAGTLHATATGGGGLPAVAGVSPGALVAATASCSSLRSPAGCLHGTIAGQDTAACDTSFSATPNAVNIGAVLECAATGRDIVHVECETWSFRL